MLTPPDTADAAFHKGVWWTNAFICIAHFNADEYKTIQTALRETLKVLQKEETKNGIANIVIKSFK